MSGQNDITEIPAPLPADYDRQYSFADFQTLNPATPLPGQKLDIELNAVEKALDQTQGRLLLIQRDDGALKNESVGLDQLSSEVLIGVNSPTNWTAFTDYAKSDSVFANGLEWYLALVSHTSSVSFAADLAAGKWKLLVDLAVAGSASAISFSPTGMISATDVQAMGAELDADITTLSAAISNNVTAIGNNATAVGNNATAIGNNATAIFGKEDADPTILKDADVGTTANKLVQLDDSAHLPAADGRNLINLPSQIVAKVRFDRNGNTSGTVVGGISITRLTTGRMRVTIPAQPDEFYNIQFTSDAFGSRIRSGIQPTTTTFDIETVNSAGTRTDYDINNILIT